MYARSLVGSVDAEGYRTAEGDILVAAAGNGLANYCSAQRV